MAFALGVVSIFKYRVRVLGGLVLILSAPPIVLYWGMGIIPYYIDGISTEVPSPKSPSAIAFELAAEEIATRETWPDSPEKVAEAYWKARQTKDYSEQAILWPVRTVVECEEICRNDKAYEYVFGEAYEDVLVHEDGTEEGLGPDRCVVPYSTVQNYQRRGEFNLKMYLRAFDTPKGKRWYIDSP